EAVDGAADHLLFPVVVEIGQQRGAGSAHRGMDVAVDPRGRHGASSGFRLGDLDVALVTVPPMHGRRKRFTEGPPCPNCTAHRSSRSRHEIFVAGEARPLWYGGRARITQGDEN